MREKFGLHILGLYANKLLVGSIKQLIGCFECFLDLFAFDNTAHTFGQSI